MLTKLIEMACEKMTFGELEVLCETLANQLRCECGDLDGCLSTCDWHKVCAYVSHRHDNGDILPLPLDQPAIKRAVGLAILKNPRVKAIVSANFENSIMVEINRCVDYKKAIKTSIDPTQK